MDFVVRLAEEKGYAAKVTVDPRYRPLRPHQNGQCGDYRRISGEPDNGRQEFPVLGKRAEDYRIIGIKSANHYRAFDKDHAALIIPVATRGIHCGDLSTYNYEKVGRPIFSLDRDFNWKAGE